MLMRRTPLRRKHKLRLLNKARRRRAYERNFGLRADAVRAMPCLGKTGGTWPTRCARRSEAAHATARGMGGVKGDRRCLVPLCRDHHEEAGEARTSKRAAFEAKYQIDLTAEAERIALQLDARGLP